MVPADRLVAIEEGHAAQPVGLTTIAAAELDLHPAATVCAIAKVTQIRAYPA